MDETISGRLATAAVQEVAWLNLSPSAESVRSQDTAIVAACHVGTTGASRVSFSLSGARDGQVAAVMCAGWGLKRPGAGPGLTPDAGLRLVAPEQREAVGTWGACPLNALHGDCAPMLLLDVRHMHQAKARTHDALSHRGGAIEALKDG